MPPRSTHPSSVQQQISHALRQQELVFEERYDRVVAQFYEYRTQYQAVMRESEHLRAVLAVKREVIALLLPFYPHPVTLELRQKIELT